METTGGKGSKVIYRSGYKGVNRRGVFRVTIVIKEMDASGQVYKKSRHLSFNTDEKPELEKVAERVDRAMMGES